MKRRGFLTSLAGLVGGAAAASVVPTLPAQPVKQTVRLRQVLVDSRSLTGFIQSSEGEQVFIDFLKKNRPVVRRLTNG